MSTAVSAIDQPDAIIRNLEAFTGPGHTRNPKVIATLMPAAFRGLVLRQGKGSDKTDMLARPR